jgi:hypothetical protein
MLTGQASGESHRTGQGRPSKLPIGSADVTPFLFVKA